MITLAVDLSHSFLPCISLCFPSTLAVTFFFYLPPTSLLSTHLSQRLFFSMLPFSPSEFYCSFEQSEIIACAAGKGRGPWASWGRRKREKRAKKKWIMKIQRRKTKMVDIGGSNRQIKKRGKEGWKRGKKGGKYLCKDNGPTTPLWAKTHVQKRYGHITWHTYVIDNVWGGRAMNNHSAEEEEQSCFYSFSYNRLKQADYSKRWNELTCRQGGRQAGRRHWQLHSQTQTRMDE